MILLHVFFSYLLFVSDLINHLCLVKCKKSLIIGSPTSSNCKWKKCMKPTLVITAAELFYYISNAKGSNILLKSENWRIDLHLTLGRVYCLTSVVLLPHASTGMGVWGHVQYCSQFYFNLYQQHSHKLVIVILLCSLHMTSIAYLSICGRRTPLPELSYLSLLRKWGLGHLWRYCRWAVGHLQIVHKKFSVLNCATELEITQTIC